MMVLISNFTVKLTPERIEAALELMTLASKIDALTTKPRALEEKAFRKFQQDPAKLKKHFHEFLKQLSVLYLLDIFQHGQESFSWMAHNYHTSGRHLQSGISFHKIKE